jgi:hypothetical protein
MNKLVLFNETIQSENFTYGTYEGTEISNYEFFDEDEETFDFFLKNSVKPDVPFDILSILNVSEITLLNDSQNLADSINFKINAVKNMFWQLSEIIVDSRNNSKIDLAKITLDKSNIYILNITNYFMLNELISYITDSIFNNLLIALGTGEFYKQAFPNFIINDICQNDKKYHILLIDYCESNSDVGFGCPQYIKIKEFLLEHIPSDKLNNIKVSFIKMKTLLLPLFLSITNVIDLVSKCFIIDTIGTGHLLLDELNKLNIIVDVIKDTQIFSLLLENKIVYYFATGNKFIYFDITQRKFIGKKAKGIMNCKKGIINRVCELDYLDDNQLLLNSFPDFDIRYADFFEEMKKKYLKYKSKYLKLKKLQITLSK